jgi:hypothetical protein
MYMSRFLVRLLLAALLIAAAGCASTQTAKYQPFTGYPFRHNGFDVKQAWKTTPTPRGLAVEGVLKNVRYPYMEDVELTVSLVRDRSKVIAQDSFFVRGTLGNDQYCNFATLLKEVTVAAGDQLRFSIAYRAVEGSSQLRWTGEFAADATTGVAIFKPGELAAEE